VNPAGDDAQRALEQRALRNVRGLLDKMEEQEQEERWSTRKLLVVFAIVCVTLLVLLAVFLFVKKPPATKAITLDPPPVRSAPK
jgi:hypothetical protein